MHTPLADEDVDLYRHPDQLPSDALELLEAHERVDMEFGADWYRNLIDAVFSDSETVCFCVARERGRAVAVLPLVLDGSGADPRRAQSLGNYYTTLFEPACDASLSAERLSRLLTGLLRQFPGIAELRFAPMAAGSPAYLRLRQALQLAGLRPFEFFCFGNWYLAPTQAWSAYLMTRSGTLRSTIRRMEKRFFGDGGTLDMVCGGEQLEQAIADYDAVYQASWKNQEPYPKFVPGLIRLCARRGWLRLGFARLNGQAIAAQLWIVSHGRAKIYKVAYREEYKSYSIGTLVSAKLMQHVLDVDKVSEVDFLSGDDPYKQTWMSHRRERWGLIAYNPRTARGAYGLMREVVWRKLKPVIGRIKAYIAERSAEGRKPA